MQDEITARIDSAHTEDYLTLWVNGTQFTYGLREVFMRMNNQAISDTPCPTCQGVGGRHFLRPHGE